MSRGIERVLFISGLLAAAVILPISGCSNRAIMDENARLKAENESLRKETVILRARTEDMIRTKPGLTAGEREEYRKRGLANPEEDIIADLGSREELMPLKGMFGARPSFYSDARLFVLNGKWAYATWTIGEKIGQRLFEYTVGENGEISWKVIATSIK